MTESAKTITFVCVGLAALALAIVTRPSSAGLDVKKTSVNEVLTKKYTSPEQAKRLRIVRVDEGSATRNTFEVAEKNGLWTLPSKQDYPADATKQMAEAATGLMDRKILEVKSENAGDHALYGVVDPLGKVEVGQKGVGTRVTVSDAQDQSLVDLVIGNEVKDSPGKRYVRVPEQPLVYVIEFDPSHLSMKFEDWIEKDLLKLSTFDIQQVEIKDYSAELVPVMTEKGLAGQITWDPRGEFTLAYSDRDSKWSPLQLRSYSKDKQGYEEFKLADDEELNGTKLNEMKTALDDLKIVDVARKPQGLSEDLKAGEDFMKNPDAQRDLIRRGFTPCAPPGAAHEEIISSDGEEIVTLKNGTEYVLRFGKVQNVEDDAANADGKADAADAAAKTDSKGIHRYLFVMARFNEAAVKKPELQDLPELPADADANIKGELKPAPGTTPDVPASINTGGEAKETGKEQEEAPASPQVAEDAAAMPQEKSDAKQDATEKPAAATATDAKEQPVAQVETVDKDAALSKIIADRKRIEAENQRKLDDYEALIKKGRENVKDLNRRFGDWYFVVDNDVFTKIRLGRDAVVKKKEKKAEEGAKKDDMGDLGAPGGMMQGLQGILGGGEKGK